ncbi:MAG: GNAT family N-acetyltransferase [Defluviitaleaceae bacterium]|nr:GNAT family N-acetyltransferase [Defluviitaleaceae bacterium]MCL2275092.1 GNAT family N-acetyltransferase [Defluviitaleaceae bacterium]
MITFNNSNDPAYEGIFDDLIQEVFGFSFAPWFAEKLWDEKYESYSIIENGVMLANVCIYKSDMLVGGKAFVAHQFGAIATRKSARGKGLSRQLMNHVLEKYPTTPAYLAANAGVVDFYPRFGFTQVQPHTPYIAAKIENDPATAVLCDLKDPKFMDALYNRAHFSHTLDTQNAQSINLFHLIMEYDEDVYFLPALNVYIIAQQEGERLFIADIIAKYPVTFAQLAGALPFAGVKEIAFGFCPKWLGVKPQWKPVDTKKDPFFIRGAWDLPEKFCFPVMAQT